MRGAVMGDHHYQHRSCSWRKMPKRCSTAGNPEDFVLIDDDDVIIVDFPESLKQKLKNSSDSRDTPLPGIISIDDDDDTHNVQQRGVGGESLDSDVSTKSYPSPGSTVLDDDDDECQVIQEKCAVFRFSKFKQIFTKKAASRNHFGLSSESENDISESDCSDCEVLDGSFREVREQWEKAFLRKRCNASKAGSHFHKEASPSEPQCDNHQSARVENTTGQHAETPFGFASANSDAGKENLSAFFATGRGNCRGNCFNPSMESFHAGPNESCDGGSVSGLKQSSTMRTEKYQGITGEHSEPNQNLKMNNSHIHPKAHMQKEDCFFPNSDQPRETQIDYKGSASLPTGKCILKASAPQTDIKAGEKQGFGDSSAYVPHKYDKDGEEKGIDPLKKLARSDFEKPIIDPSASASGHIEGVNTTPDERDIINDREKLKETDEYKKAIEAEWESRQQQLRIQAEEVQRLRKRRKLESMRRLDMERKQKLRLEEMRETQKKDEENMNLKELLRIEARKKLSKLEITCIDMASLLRGLGIPVGGGVNPASHEVRAAYKRAVLKFHPDRASVADIQLQVEAEEKFKLISRMKEKFLSAPPCC